MTATVGLTVGVGRAVGRAVFVGDATGETVGVGAIDGSVVASGTVASDEPGVADGTESVEAGVSKEIEPGDARAPELGAVDSTAALEQPAADAAIANTAKRAAARGRRADTGTSSGTTAGTIGPPL